MRSHGAGWRLGVATWCASATFVATSAAHAHHEGDERIVDDTAHTLRARETRIGLWKIEFAPVAFMTVGTDTAPWAASFLFHSVVANGHVKVRLLHTGPLTVSGSTAVYHAGLDPSGTVVAGNGSLLLVPFSVFASSDLSPLVSLHAGATYAHAELDGDVNFDPGSSPARAAFAMSALQLHAMGEVRVNRVIALTLELHGQPYMSAVALHVTTSDPSGGRVEFAGTMKSVAHTGVAAVASVVISGNHFNLRVGGGYGAIFLPSMGMMIPTNTVLPELDAYVRF